MKIKNIYRMLFLISDLIKLKKQQKDDKNFEIKKYYPIIKDKRKSSGVMSGHYFHQDLLVARKIFNKNPKTHVDIGSRTDGFVSSVAAFREIQVFDIRNQESKVKNIVFKQADFMKIPESIYGYSDSVSALHSIEHFGLGRYNDPIDYNGHLKGIDSIYNLLVQNGTFYFSVPIGPQRIEFNAHRVFSIKYLLNIFEGRFKIIDFSYVDDHGDLHESSSLSEENIKSNFGCHYGCGIFELLKL